MSAAEVQAAAADAAALRRLGPRVLELLARHRERLATGDGPDAVPVTTRRSPAELLERFGGPLPVDPLPEDAVLAELEAVLAESIDLAHPRDLCPHPHVCDLRKQRDAADEHRSAKQEDQPHPG